MYQSTNSKGSKRAGKSCSAPLSVLALSILCLTGCDAVFGGEESPTGVAEGAGVGDSCSVAGDCRTGLRCDDGLCTATGSQPENGRCTLSAECADGLYCSELSICALAGEAKVDESCNSNGDCLPGLYCELRGFVGVCSEPGTGDSGDTCQSTADCLAGLGCIQPDPTVNATACTPGSAGGGLVLVTPVECEPPGIPDGGDFQVFFEIPRAGEEVTEFYRLPFPNDIRLSGGRIDLSGHPRPELDVVGNVIKTLIEQAESDISGFGTHQAGFFRFNEFPDPDSVTISGDNPVLSLVNINPESRNYGRRTSLSWSATDGRGSFICNNWLAVRPLWSQAFEHGSTYATIITSGVRSRNGDQPAQSDDFELMMNGRAPEESELASAWEAYAPLRAYLLEQGIPSGTIMGASVFTIDDPDQPIDGISAALEPLDPPTNSELVLCRQGALSPCDDGFEGEDHVRGCFTESEDHFEIHTTVDIPVFQVGEPPYLEQDGGLLFDDNGVAILQRTESVCTTITVPKTSSMPAQGWPMVVYAHGTGGNFRGHVDELASELSELGYATIGYEGVQHGDRRGDSTDPPEGLFFNFINPRASYGNVLQGAVDVLSYGRFAEAFQVEGADSPTTGIIRFNPDKLVFFGHSQGGTVGSIAAAGDHNYSAIVLSGTGGGLLLSLLEKSEPVDIASGISLVLQESSSEFHPVLNLIQMYFEGVDPLNYAARVIRQRPEGAHVPNLFQSYGIGDSYTPDPAIEALSGVLGLSILTPVIDGYGRPEVEPPVTGNVADGAATAAIGQYQPAENEDGHFVIFDNDDAHAQLMGFLETLALEPVPTIPAVQ